jgi:hypothetical protein
MKLVISNKIIMVNPLGPHLTKNPRPSPIPPSLEKTLPSISKKKSLKKQKKWTVFYTFSNKKQSKKNSRQKLPLDGAFQKAPRKLKKIR